MASYEYNVWSPTDLKSLEEDLTNFAKLFSQKKFCDFLADKCMEELEDIQSFTDFPNEHSVFWGKVQEYIRNHKKEVRSNYVEIYNNTRLEQGEMFWVSPSTLLNYPDGISIAKIIEYGTGIRGTSVPEWEADVNHHGASGWWYYDPDDEDTLTHTYGLEGRFIYLQLYDRVRANVRDWVFEYMEKEAEFSGKPTN